MPVTEDYIIARMHSYTMSRMGKSIKTEVLGPGGGGEGGHWRDIANGNGVSFGVRTILLKLIVGILYHSEFIKFIKKPLVCIFYPDKAV